MGRLTEFIRDYNHNDISRFHMPGHKGNCSFLEELGGPYDITEIQGADSLFRANGLLMELEQRYSELYQCHTVLSTGGSTLCIQAMLALRASQGKVLAARNAHTSFINACVLFDITPVWIYPDYSVQTGLPMQPSAGQVEDMLKADPEIKTVYITSPDYMGIMADIAEIAVVCHKHKVKLLVDNAHGAHLKFGTRDLFPIALGADLCCSSAHKTLPVLTGGAYLHTKEYSPEHMKSAMSLFASTSPSYLVLQSLDLCADYLKKQGRQDFKQLEQQWERLSKTAIHTGIAVYGDDKTKLTFDAASAGMDGEQLARYFRNHRIEPEYVGHRHVVLMISPFLSSEDYSRLESALKTLPGGQRVEMDGFAPVQAEQVLPPRAAAFSPWENCTGESAVGRVCAENITTCPPGIPIISYGELISEPIVNLLKNSGINRIKVVK